LGENVERLAYPPAMPLRIALLLTFFAGIAQGCSDGDDCGAVRCGCLEGSAVIVRVPGAPDGTTVTADTLMCTDVRSGRSDCTSIEMPYPQRAMIGAPGYASVEVALTRSSSDGGRCCPCEGSERWQGDVTLTAAATLDSGSGG